MMIRTRMAPSPTGEYHIGGMRTLLYNYALAKKSLGKFILRIEDTDRERLVEGATERAIQVIRDYGLNWDEGPVVGGPFSPYVQSKRLEIYKKYADQLIESGKAYYCFCTKERLEELRNNQQAEKMPSTKYDKFCLNLTKEEVAAKLKAKLPYVIRLNVPKDEIVSFEDKILGKISFPTNDIDDQVLLKSDGFPTYHLAVVVDDHLMEINTVMRGMEWLPSTPKHILLYQAFGWEIPSYAHLPLLKEQGDTKKLSKRMGSVAAAEFLKEGYLPEALLNFLMFLGWNPGTEKEIYSLHEFIRDFSVAKIHRTDLVVFDRTKLLWINGVYIRNTKIEDLYDNLKLWADKYGITLNGQGERGDFHLKVLTLVQDRMRTLSEFNELTKYFYQSPLVEKDLLLSFCERMERSQKILKDLYELYYQVNDWDKNNLDVISHELISKLAYTPKEAFMTLRIAITGEKNTPPIFDILEILGKSEVLKRLQLAQELFLQK